MTATKPIHSKKGVAPKSKSDVAKTIRKAKDIVEAAPVEAPKPNMLKRAVTYVKENPQKVTKKTTEVAWGATWRTAATGVAVPYVLSLADIVTTHYHNVVAKGGHYSNTLKEALAQTFDTVQPAVTSVSDHPVIATLVVAAIWVANKFVGDAKK
jgi:hypothetical protein